MESSQLSHTPLLNPAGPHALEWHQFKELVLAQRTQRREQLWEGLAALAHYFQRADLANMEIWIDGSMVTSKPIPVDVDVVVWVPPAHVDHCAQPAYEMLERLKNRSMVRQKYLVDLYIGNAESNVERDYWRAHFSRAKDGSPKGFAQITL